PIHNGAVIEIVRFAIPPIVINLISDLLFVEFHTEPGSLWNFYEARIHFERRFNIALAEADLFLTKEIRYRCGQLQSCRKRDGPERVMRSDAGVIGFGHPCYKTRFHDPARMAEVWLQNERRAFFQNFVKAALRESAVG